MVPVCGGLAKSLIRDLCLLLPASLLLCTLQARVLTLSACHSSALVTQRHCALTRFPQLLGLASFGPGRVSVPSTASQFACACGSVMPEIGTFRMGQAVPRADLAAPRQQGLRAYGHTHVHLRQSLVRTGAVPAVSAAAFGAYTQATVPLQHLTCLASHQQKPELSQRAAQAIIHPLIHHAPKLADVLNMLILAAAAGGSGLLATAKYLHESSVRRELQDRHPAEVRLRLATAALSTP